MKEFGSFRLDVINQCLWRRGETGPDERLLLTPKACGLLDRLVEHAGRLVTHEDLLEAVWPKTHVQPQAVKKLIVDLRNLLGDRAGAPRFIETVHRRGYRFIAPVRESAGEPLTAVSPVRSNLVGREAPLAQLQACLGSALRGERQIVFVTGEPGIGKTVLVDEFQRQAVEAAPGIWLARGQCIDGSDGKEAYYPVLEALGQLCRDTGGRSIVEVLSAQAPTWLVQFPALVTPERREAFQQEILGVTRERMLREFGDALEALTVIKPLVLIFEDLQWADRPTIELIATSARRRAPARLLLLGTKRPLDGASRQLMIQDDLLIHQLCRDLALAPLAEAEIEEYLRREAPFGSMPEGLVQLIYRYSEGNPLFMAAALEHLGDRGLLSRIDGGWRLSAAPGEIAIEVPRKLHPLIETQIERLTPDEERALEVAAIQGAIFVPEICAPAAQLEAEVFEDLCQKFARRNFILRALDARRSPRGAVWSCYQFVHAVYREACYRRVPSGRRTKLHLHLAQRLEALYSARLEEVAAELAHHFEAACDSRRALKYSQLWAQTARHRAPAHEGATVLRREANFLQKRA